MGSEWGDGNTGYWTVFYAPKQPVLLHVPDELGYDNVASARQSVVLDERTAADVGGDHAVKKRGFTADEVCLST